MRTNLIGSLALFGFLCLPGWAADITSQKTVQSWAYIGFSGVQPGELERISTQIASIRGIEFATVNPDARESNTSVIRKSASADWPQVFEALANVVRAFRGI